VSETDGNGRHSYDDLAPGEFLFLLRSKDYALREPSEAAVLAYKGTQLRDQRLAGGTMTADASKMAEADVVLVQLSTFDAKGNLASVQEVRSWPHRVTKDLAERAKKMAGLDRADKDSLRLQIAALQKQLRELDALDGSAETPEKNSPAGTTAT
jgi:polyhydroxyalkanoate synthesis regulator phasin